MSCESWPINIVGQCAPVAGEAERDVFQNVNRGSQTPAITSRRSGRSELLVKIDLKDVLTGTYV